MCPLSCLRQKSLCAWYAVPMQLERAQSEAILMSHPALRHCWDLWLGCCGLYYNGQHVSHRHNHVEIIAPTQSKHDRRHTCLRWSSASVVEVLTVLPHDGVRYPLWLPKHAPMGVHAPIASNINISLSLSLSLSGAHAIAMLRAGLQHDSRGHHVAVFRLSCQQPSTLPRPRGS